MGVEDAIAAGPRAGSRGRSGSCSVRTPVIFMARIAFRP
jgi:hypothetical protein